MFDEKIKIAFNKKHVVTKKISGAEIKISPYLVSSEITFILDKCVAHFNDLFQSDNLITAVASTVAQMELLVCANATNVDLEGAKYDDISSCGLIQVVRETVVNYDTIKSALLLAICPVCIDKLVTLMGNMASSEELSETTNHIAELFKQNPEKAKMFAEITKANNPSFNKIVDIKGE